MNSFSNPSSPSMTEARLLLANRSIEPSIGKLLHGQHVTVGIAPTSAGISGLVHLCIRTRPPLEGLEIVLSQQPSGESRRTPGGPRCPINRRTVTGPDGTAHLDCILTESVCVINNEAATAGHSSSSEVIIFPEDDDEFALAASSAISDEWDDVGDGEEIEQVELAAEKAQDEWDEDLACSDEPAASDESNGEP